MSSSSNNNSMSALAVGAAVGALGLQAARRLSKSSLLEEAAQELRPSLSESSVNEKAVGILAIEVYTPSTYISQSDLEEHSGVSKGKYTLGLGQEGLGICGDAEDVNSLSLTVVHSLLEKWVNYGMKAEIFMNSRENSFESSDPLMEDRIWPFRFCDPEYG